MSKSERRSASTTSLVGLSASGSALDDGMLLLQPPRPATTAPSSPLLKALNLERRNTDGRRSKVKVRTGRSATNVKSDNKHIDAAADVTLDEESLWREQCVGCTDEQLALVEQFHAWVLSDSAPRSQWVPRDRFVAIKFIRGCKFDRVKAEKKYAKWVAVRDVFGDCSLDRVAPFLATNAHSMPPGAVDNNGCGMMYVNVALMDKNHDFKTRNRARSLIYLFDKSLQQRNLQESGLSLCIDFKDAPFLLNRQAQTDTHHLIDALPCRLGSGYIVDAPWFFSILLNIASKFTAQKLLSRVVLRSRSEMPTLVPRAHLLRSLGGVLDFDPYEWLIDEYAATGQQAPFWVLQGGPPPPPVDEGL